MRSYLSTLRADSTLNSSFLHFFSLISRVDDSDATTLAQEKKEWLSEGVNESSGKQLLRSMEKMYENAEQNEVCGAILLASVHVISAVSFHLMHCIAKQSVDLFVTCSHHSCFVVSCCITQLHQLFNIEIPPSLCSSLTAQIQRVIDAAASSSTRPHGCKARDCFCLESAQQIDMNAYRGALNQLIHLQSNAASAAAPSAAAMDVTMTEEKTEADRHQPPIQQAATSTFM